MPSLSIDCFLANDVRGIVPDQLNSQTAYRIGRAFGEFLNAKTACVGHDIRHSSPDLTQALTKGLLDAGCDVYPLGLCGTEQVYFSVSHLNLDCGIMVTASHNPSQYNGIKFVRSNSRPVGKSTGLVDIQNIAEKGLFIPTSEKGKILTHISPEAYIAHILEYIDIQNLKPLKIVLDSGNGCAGPILDKLESQLPFNLIKIRNEPDGDFPSGIPNPLLPENRKHTAQAVIKNGADFGVAVDGDFDRCFFFDESGYFVEGYYLVALLAEIFLKKEPGGSIIHDPRLVWNTIETVKQCGGKAIMSCTGHAFIKQRMREKEAIYGGEMSGHHYFKNFSYCDSGMIPWLLIAELLSSTNKSLSSFVKEARNRYPISGEINRSVTNMDAAISSVRQKFERESKKIDETDGVSMEFQNWRFNLRTSNTEQLLRLNVETRNDLDLLNEKVSKLLKIIDTFCVSSVATN